MLKLCVYLHNLYTRPLLPRDERGVTSVEYGLLVALIAIAIVGSVTAFSGALNSVFGSVGNTIRQPPPAG